MAWIIRGETITDAWLAALEYLDAHEREAFDLLVEIADSSPDAADRAVIAAVDALLATSGHHRVDTVVNTMVGAHKRWVKSSAERRPAW